MIIKALLLYILVQIGDGQTCTSIFFCNNCTSNSHACSECNTEYSKCSYSDWTVCCPGNCTVGFIESHNPIAIACSACKNGFYGKTCKQHCDDHCVQCDQTSGSCKKCVEGKYGFNCEKTCPQNCGNKTCGIEKGKCYDCKVGYYGDRCGLICSKNCMNISCKQTDGTCTSSCEKGWYGKNCKNECPRNCENNECYRDSGNCKEGCKNQNTHGAMCTKECSNTCNENKCEQFSGNCTNGCQHQFNGKKCDKCTSGYFGMNCTDICPANCKFPKCGKEKGKCIGGCVSDFIYGEFCDTCMTSKWGEKCLQNCSWQCRYLLCHKNNGTCSHGCSSNFKGLNCSECKFGFFGDHCNLTCPNCRNSTCLFDGSCSTCPDSLTGKYCDNKCPVNCLKSSSTNQTCDISGYCIHGCKDGFYNHKCTETCSNTCFQGKCDQVTGNCLFGCEISNSCENDLSNDSQDSSALVGGVAGGCGLVLVVGVILTVCILQKRNGNAKKSNTAVKRFKKHIFAVRKEETKQGGQVLKAKTSVKEDVVLTKPKNIKDTQILAEDELEEIDEFSTQAETVPTDSVYCNVPQPVPVERLASYIARHTSEDYKFEFLTLPLGLTQPYNESQKPCNVSLNRYRGIYPYDNSRVTIGGDPDFYINACFIDVR